MYGWNLTGTENQKRIIREGFEKIKFPFDRLTLPGTPELGWRNLNDGSFLNKEVARHHEGEPHEDEPDVLEGAVEGKRWIMGVIYPSSGRIYLDTRLEQHPNLAQAVLGAELAHAVDFFLPMTDEMRNELLRLWNLPGTTWWETFDYGSEYFRLGGEAFMHEFVAAYADLDFGDKSSFIHDAGVEPEDVRRVLGIPRTDEAPQPIDEPISEPINEPGLDPSQFVHFPKSGKNIYHERTHYDNRKSAVPLVEFEGFRPCKVCKPETP